MREKKIILYFSFGAILKNKTESKIGTFSSTQWQIKSVACIQVR